MISVIYPNKYDNGVKRYVPPITYIPNTPKVTTYPYPSTQLSQAAIRAAKINITTIEWQRRDEIVRAMARQCNLNFMDTFYPPTLDDYIKYGKCVYLGKAQAYAEIDTDDWPKTDSPLIFSAQSLNDDGEKSNFCCNLAFIQKEMPKK